MQPHIRAFVERAVTFAVCPDCGGTRLNAVARSSKIRGINIADACAMQISDLAEWVRGLDEPSVAPLLASLAWQIYQATKDEAFLKESYPKLLKFFWNWFSPAHDHDRDGLPEWDHLLQTGWEDNPLFDTWNPWSQGLNVSTVDNPGLYAMLAREAHHVYSVEIVPELKAQAEEKLRERGVQAHSELLAGHPSEIIHQMADEQHPHLIVLGAKGRRATAGIQLGGVAQQVVEYSNSPVLVVRSPYQGLERILLVIDGSLASQCSVEYIARLPLPEASAIEIVHVLPPLPLPQPMLAAPV